jgi:hypothetical protein
MKSTNRSFSLIDANPNACQCIRREAEFSLAQISENERLTFHAGQDLQSHAL